MHEGRRRPAPKGEQNLRKPTLKLDPATSATTSTCTRTAARFTIRLATRSAPPRRSASFAALVKRGFYDGLTFHRIVRDFVIQGGDPLGTGRAGPATRSSSRRPPTSSTRRASSRWPRPRSSRPGTSGSQFFIVTAPDAGLPPDYAVAGARDSQAVVDTIAHATDPGPRPAPVVIDQGSAS